MGAWAEQPVRGGTPFPAGEGEAQVRRSPEDGSRVRQGELGVQGPRLAGDGHVGILCTQGCLESSMRSWGESVDRTETGA